MPGQSTFPITDRTLQTLQQKLLALLNALETHSSFASQSATYSGKIYFTWDFVMRTSAMLDAVLNNTIPPDTLGTRDTIPAGTKYGNLTEAQKKELKEDILGRCMMADLLLNEGTGETETLSGAIGLNQDVGERVKQASKGVVESLG